MTGRLTDAQQRLLDEWMPHRQLIADHTWPLQDTTVLQFAADGREYIVKATETSHHFDRELVAHRLFLKGVADVVPRLVHASEEHRILVTTFLPGRLVEGSRAEHDPATYRDAGGILARFLTPLGESNDYLPYLVAKSLRQVDEAVDLVDSDRLAALRREFEHAEQEPVHLHFTHGDFQPRNWLVHDGAVRLIDFGRALPRHWTSDLVRMQHKQFVSEPGLELAFFEGLDRELTEQDRRVLRLEHLSQALGTVVWAHSIGDADFEEHGRVMLARLLPG